MIKALGKSGRVPQVRMVCDGCGKDEVLVCDYEHGPGHVWTPNQGQAERKIVRLGWELLKGRHHCPACKAKRKAASGNRERGPKVTTSTGLRQPTREQRRQIVSLLDEVYDVKAERYIGAETDKSVSETLGAGCMPGWVAEIREEMYGPDGGNDDMVGLRAELAEWRSGMDRRAQALHDAHVAFSTQLREFNADRDKVRDYERRLAAITAAVGPKGGAGT